MNKANDFLNGIKGIGKYISDRYYLTLLKDTPTGYQGHSGDYLVVNDGETGIHFTGIEKIASDLTDYGFLDGVGGGGGGGGSNSFGIIASKMDGINFTGELPDIIFQKDENGLEAALILQYAAKTLNKIQYAANTAGTNRILRFDNSATAGNMTNNGTWTLGSNSPGPVSVQHFIDTDKAAYLGGGGGRGSSDSSNIFGAEIKVNSSNIVTIVSQTSDFIESIEQDTGSATNPNNFTITFKDGIFTETPLLSSTVRNRDGTLVEVVTYNRPNPLPEDYTNGKLYKIKFEATDPTTKDVNLGNGNWGANLIFIKNGNDFIAGGGSGGSSTFADLTDTPSTLTEGSGQYLKVSDDGQTIEYVDLPAGGGVSGSSSSGGGFQSNQITKDNFAGDFALPDALYVPLIRSGMLTLRPFYFNGFHGTTENAFAYIQYEWIIGLNERFSINFSNNTHGGFASATNHESTTTTFNLSTIPSTTTNQPSIKEFIADDRALYFGGSGGGTTNTQELTEQISQTIVNDNLIILDTDYSFQTKYLNGSISSDSNITDLEFTNLTIGDAYRLSSTVSINSDGTAGDKIKVNYYHDGNKIAAVYSDNISQSVSTSVLFNATSNSLLVSGQNLDANNYIEGNPNEITFTQVEKITNNMIAPEIIAITDGSTQTFDGATMADNNYIKIEGENVSATIEIDGDSFVVAQSGDQMVWDQGGAGETTLSLGNSINVTLSNGRVIEIKFYRSGSLYFAINKKSEPEISQCISSPVTITVESEYDSETSTSTFNYITSNSSGNGGLFGCIDVNRGETLTIFVTGDEPNLLSHPLKITNYNDLGQAMAPLSGVVKTDLTEGPYEDHTYSLTWQVPCDEAIDKYQYQCENHAGMRGTINVLGVCPSPTPTPTATVTPTPSITPTITPTPSVSAGSTGDYFDTFNSNEEMFLPITLE